MNMKRPEAPSESFMLSTENAFDQLIACLSVAAATDRDHAVVMGCQMAEAMNDAIAEIMDAHGPDDPVAWEEIVSYYAASLRKIADLMEAKDEMSSL